MAGIVEEPFKAISILYRKSHIWLSEGCEQYDLTAAQAVVILIVCDHGELTQDEVTKLAELGFIERSTNPKDKRTFDIRPTEKARAAYPHVQEQIENCFGRMTGRMSDSERDEFRRLLLLAAETTLAQDE